MATPTAAVATSEVLSVAAIAYRTQRALVRRITAEAAKAWRQIDVRFLDHSWFANVGPRLFAIVSAGQFLAASSADGYVDRILTAEGLATDAAGETVAHALSAVASDGRPLDSLLYTAVIATKAGIGRGLSDTQALQSGLMSLDMITRTQVQDAGRVGTSVATAARPQVNGYVRMLNPPSCSRCVILAGRFYRWNAGFERHPSCDCTHIPASENTAGDLTTSPTAYFESLDEAEQNATFTKAGAQAIRDGANISQVVNARRGMYTAGIGNLTVKATREGVTSRGEFGHLQSDLRKSKGNRYRTSQTIRIMPEEIYRAANDNREEAIRLLRKFGYLR